MCKSPPSLNGQQRVAQLMRQAFDTPREPRSEAYKAGVRAMLSNKIYGLPFNTSYKAGTAEADAWAAGLHEGRAIAKVNP